MSSVSRAHSATTGRGAAIALRAIARRKTCNAVLTSSKLYFMQAERGLHLQVFGGQQNASLPTESAATGGFVEDVKLF